MSTAIGIALFVVGLGALLLSVLMERRPRSVKPPTPVTAAGPPEPEVDVAVEGSEADAAVEAPPVVTAPEGPAPSTAEEPAPTAEKEGPTDKAEAAEARLAQLRAELTGPASHEPEPPAATPGSAPTRTEAGRVFAAVASVGRAPEEPARDVPPSSPETAVPAGPSATLAVAEVAGHGHPVPLVNHSDLVAHLRREHPDLESGGSTIQTRLLHERAHADGA